MTFPFPHFKGSSGPSDTSFSSVVFLSGYNGANGGTTFVDESPLANTITTRASAITSTTQVKYGSSALFVDGSFSTPSCLTLDSVTSRIIPATAAFCFETWFYTTADFSADQCMFGQWMAVAPNLQWSMWITGGNHKKLDVQLSTTGSDAIHYQDTNDVTVNTWTHAAFDWDGSKYRLFKDGVMVASSTTSRTIATNTAPFTIGCHGNRDSAFFKGYLDETRVTNASRYGSDSSFTPPTAAFPRS